MIFNKKRESADYGLRRPVGPRRKNQSKNKYLDLARELKKAMEHKCNGDTINDLCIWNGLQSLERSLEELESGRRIKTIQTTTLKRSAKILRRFRKKLEDICSILYSGKRPSPKARGKNSHGVIQLEESTMNGIMKNNT